MSEEIKPDPKPESMQVDPTTAPAATPAVAEETKPETKPEASSSTSKRPHHVTPNQDTIVVEKLEGKTEDEIKSIKEKVVGQIKFYFSDSNLPFDKFLWTLSMKNPSGWVPLSTVCSFKRMRGYTEEYGEQWIMDAIKEVEDSLEESDKVVVVEPGVEGAGARIRRRRKLEKDSTAWDRSVYVKGFAEGETEHNSQLQVEEWFRTGSAGPAGVKKEGEEESVLGNGKGGFEVNAVRFRRAEDTVTGSKFGKFKGSVFAEFKNLSDVEAFLKLDPKPTFQGEPVLAMTKEAYVQMKVKEKGLDQSSIQRSDKKSSNGNTKPNSYGPNNPNKKFNAFVEMDRIKANGGKLPDFIVRENRGIAANGSEIKGEKRKRDGDDEGEEAESKKVKKEEPATITYNGKEVAIDRQTGVVLDKAELTFPENALLKFTNVGEGGDWKILKTDLVAAGFEGTFMSFPPGQLWGYLCLPATIEDEYITRLRDAKLTSAGQELVWERVPAGNDEREFYALRANFQGKVKVKQLNDAAEVAGKEAMQKRGGDRDRGSRGRGGGRGRGGNRGGGRGRGGGSRGGGRDRDGGRNGGNKMDVDAPAARAGPPVVKATDA